MKVIPHWYIKRARAIVKGNKNYESIQGEVIFTENPSGVMIETKINGLKKDTTKECTNDFCGMHIHEGKDCEYEEAKNKYINIGTHYNPDNCPHPMHKGDLLPIIKNNTYSYSKVLYTKFTIDELIGKFVIIHEGSDDFKTNPSGDSKNMIACGKIYRY